MWHRLGANLGGAANPPLSVTPALIRFSETHEPAVNHHNLLYPSATSDLLWIAPLGIKWKASSASVMNLFSVELEKENQTSKERLSTQLAQVFRITFVLVDTTDADTGTIQG